MELIRIGDQIVNLDQATRIVDEGPKKAIHIYFGPNERWTCDKENAEALRNWLSTKAAGVLDPSKPTGKEG